MSFERFLAIRFSYFYARHITRRKAQLTFLGCWGVTCVFTALPFVGFGSYELQFPKSWCFLNFHKESLTDSIYAALFGIFNIVAICVMFVCNVSVAGTLFRMRQSRQLNSSPSIDRKLSLSGIAGSSTTGTVIRAKKHSDMEAQMIWFLGLITIAFSVCWMPLNIHILVTQITGKTDNHLDLTVIRMASSNQILDPWLYVIFRKNSMLRILRRVKACFRKTTGPPRNGGTFKGPPVRYVMGNKSFTFEATTVGKTVMGAPRGCNRSPSYNRPPEDYADDSVASNDSVPRLMSVCSNNDEKNSRRRSDLNPLINLRLGSSPTDVRKVSYSEGCQDGHRISVVSKNIPADQSVSLPLLDHRVKINATCAVNGRWLGDGSDSKEVLHGVYDSVGSTSRPTKAFPQNAIHPGTPTKLNNHRSNSPLTAPVVFDSSFSHLQRRPPRSLVITDSNYVVFNPPLATPEHLSTPSPIRARSATNCGLKVSQNSDPSTNNSIPAKSDTFSEPSSDYGDTPPTLTRFNVLHNQPDIASSQNTTDNNVHPKEESREANCLQSSSTILENTAGQSPPDKSGVLSLRPRPAAKLFNAETLFCNINGHVGKPEIVESLTKNFHASDGSNLSEKNGMWLGGSLNNDTITDRETRNPKCVSIVTVADTCAGFTSSLCGDRATKMSVGNGRGKLKNGEDNVKT
ncbi:unnamed protein product [Lymnaea stagnalis]|uniref:G-protein coupled receptors family 1 profile domain-containing protein n=1 Tax=Lymnaea stagnalis TaxID=6523 RepID=A0AAV2HCJ3_LYMST